MVEQLGRRRSSRVEPVCAIACVCLCLDGRAILLFWTRVMHIVSVSHVALNDCLTWQGGLS